jgi:glyceraldehyde 3-phosphate dehydrogenase
MIPTSTGAAKAIFQIYPELKGKLKAISIRVPIPDVSLVDLAVILKEDVSRDAVNESFKRASETYLSGTLKYIEEPLVSSDFIGSKYLSIVDGLLTEVIDGNMVKVLAWYDNEAGYAHHLAKLSTRLL